MSSPSSHRPNTEYHTPLRTRIRSMYNNAAIPKRQIAKRLDIPYTSVQFVLQKDYSRRPSTTRQRPPLLSDFDVDQIIKKAIGSFKNRTFT